MPKNQNPEQSILDNLNDTIAQLRLGKKVNVPQLEKAIDRCELAVKASLQVLKHLRAEVQKLKKKPAKPKPRKP